MKPSDAYPAPILWLESQIRESNIALDLITSLRSDFSGEPDKNGKVYKMQPYLSAEVSFDPWRHTSNGLALAQSAISIVANNHALALLEAADDWLLHRIKEHETALAKLRGVKV